jgi:hypothetical protein
MNRHCNFCLSTFAAGTRCEACGTGFGGHDPFNLFNLLPILQCINFYRRSHGIERKAAKWLKTYKKGVVYNASCL